MPRHREPAGKGGSSRWRDGRRQKKGRSVGRKKEGAIRRRNWPGLDDLSKSRQRLISYSVLPRAPTIARPEAATGYSSRGSFSRTSSCERVHTIVYPVRIAPWRDSPPPPPPPPMPTRGGSASRNSICRELARRVTETVEPDKLVIERRYFLII